MEIRTGYPRMSTILIGFKPGVLTDAQLGMVGQAVPGMRLVVTADRDEMAAVLDDVEIATAMVPGSLLAAAPRLRWFQAWGAGVEWVLQYPAAIERDFVLTNTSGIHPIQMAEHVLALMLAFARRLPDAMHAQAGRTWRHMENAEVFELAGKTMLLVGVGAIGRRTAQAAAALGVRVLGIRRVPSGRLPGIERLAGIESLQDLLPEADFVVLLTPLTPETRHLIGERELRLMKRDAYLVNVSRGGVVDEAALVRALREGWIAGAGLDVFEHEPLPADSPLWDLRNVVITGHYGGASPAYDDRAFEVFLDNLHRYRAGQPLRNVVDKRHGY
jgi:phosphoglycerate dehydrogenase-like enzyme